MGLSSMQMNEENYSSEQTFELDELIWTIKSSPSTLTAASGHPKTTGSLPAYPWHSNLLPHCSILPSAPTRVFLACLSTHDLEEARDWPSKLWSYREVPHRQLLFLIHSLRVESPKDLLPLEQISGDQIGIDFQIFPPFSVRGEELAASANKKQQYRESQQADFQFPLSKNIVGQREFSHNFIMLSTQTLGN